MKGFLYQCRFFRQYQFFAQRIVDVFANSLYSPSKEIGKLVTIQPHRFTLNPYFL